MTRHQHLILNQQPLAFGSLTNWLQLVSRHGGVDRNYIPRALFVTLSSALSSPLRIYEQARFKRQIEEQAITDAPIFIIGHWRSGTTYLHHLMSLDTNFSYISTLQAWAPELVLSSRRLIAPILEWMTPNTRPMDNVKLALDYPQEEEFCLANISPFSFYHGWYFPRHMSEYFNQFALFDAVSPDTLNAWKYDYIKVIKIATLRANGQRLLIKNPVNTGRIRILLELFPNAKFIHIYRNPYLVYFSTQRLYQKLLPVVTLQNFDEDVIEQNILSFYQKIMEKFFIEKHLIPPDNLIEIRYEDLENDPIQELHRIYSQLDLAGFEHIQDIFNTYIQSQCSYQRNSYTTQDHEMMQKIYHHWRFTIDKWHYSEPTPSPCESII